MIAASSGYVDPELYPFTGKIFDRNGWGYHYLDEGPEVGGGSGSDGRNTPTSPDQVDPVIMVHGNPSWSITFRHVVQALRPRYRAIVPDHLGCGLSDKPPASAYGYRLEDRVDDLAALVASLSLERKITLIAHDWGGMIAMAYANRVPHRIGRIVLFNTAAFHLPAHMRLPSAIAQVRDGRLGAWAVQGLNVFARGAAWVGCKRQRMPRRLRQAYCAPYNTWDNRLATLRFVQDIPLRPSHPSYQAVTAVEEGLSQFIDTPILLCWGMLDFVFTGEVLELFTRRWPHAEVERYADCGHYVQEDAADQVACRVRRFLDAHPLAGQ